MKKVLALLAALVLSLQLLPQSLTAAPSEAVMTAAHYHMAKFEAMIAGDVAKIEQFFDISNPTSRKTAEYEETRLAAWLYQFSHYGTDITWYSGNVNAKLISSEGQKAVVEVTYADGVQQADTGDKLQAWGGETHLITLNRSSEGTWVVSKDEYMDSYRETFGQESNLSNVKEKLDSIYAKEKERNATAEKNKQEAKDRLEALESAAVSTKKAADGSTQSFVITGGTYYLYTRWAAQDYAREHTNNLGGYTRTSEYSEYFPDFCSLGGDCANFVSQCLWRGFSGYESSIENMQVPMISSSVPNATDWYCTLNSGSSTAWKLCTALRNMLINNYSQSLTGPRGYWSSVAYMNVGDILYSDAHVWICTTANGTEGSRTANDLYFSAHTANRLDLRLVNYIGDYQQLAVDCLYIPY